MLDKLIENLLLRLRLKPSEDCNTVGNLQLSDNSWTTLSTDQEWKEESEQALRKLYETMPYYFPASNDGQGFDDEDYQYPE